MLDFEKKTANLSVDVVQSGEERGLVQNDVLFDKQPNFGQVLLLPIVGGGGCCELLLPGKRRGEHCSKTTRRELKNNIRHEIEMYDFIG